MYKKSTVGKRKNRWGGPGMPDEQQGDQRHWSGVSKGRLVEVRTERQ